MIFQFFLGVPLLPAPAKAGAQRSQGRAIRGVPPSPLKGANVDSPLLSLTQGSARLCGRCAPNKAFESKIRVRDSRGSPNVSARMGSTGLPRIARPCDLSRTRFARAGEQGHAQKNQTYIALSPENLPTCHF